VLANDYLACRLARMIGLSVPEPVIILVDEKTILEQQITFTLAGRAVAARPGLQFGSAMVTGHVWDWPSASILGRVKNFREFAGVLAFDKWTGNADGRQVVFHKEMREREYTASLCCDFSYVVSRSNGRCAEERILSGDHISWPAYIFLRNAMSPR
jgi:hypothetical protein